MLKLSQRAWNNVIIISMLILIVMFNFSSNILNGENDVAATERGLIPQGMIITTMQFPHYQVERIGQGWRSNLANSSLDKLIELTEQWQQAQIQPLAPEHELSTPDAEQSIKVQVWLAGQAAPVVYQFWPDTQPILVSVDEQMFQLLSTDYHSLTLTE
ncbi:hypothetical protein [Paraglaciecola aestuariivivens]